MMCLVFMGMCSCLADVLASYTHSSLRVSEGEGLVDVCVQMTGFAAVPLTVKVSTQPDTALGM